MPNPTVPLDAQLVRAAVAQTRFADVRYVPQTTSTNADAFALLDDGAALGATIVAEYQTAGVGRKGRRWIAPPGSALLFTTILPQAIASESLWAVPFWIALAVAHAVEHCCDQRLELVWPNDLHVRSGKTGGILSVARIAGDIALVGCGVGLNVCRPAADVELDALVPQPVFLDDLASSVDRARLLAGILHAFDRSLTELDHPEGIARQWEHRAQLAGTLYRYRNDADGIERSGVAQRLGHRGSLIVRDASGETVIDMADVRVTGRAHCA